MECGIALLRDNIFYLHTANGFGARAWRAGFPGSSRFRLLRETSGRAEKSWNWPKRRWRHDAEPG